MYGLKLENYKQYRHVNRKIIAKDIVDVMQYAKPIEDQKLIELDKEFNIKSDIKYESLNALTEDIKEYLNHALKLEFSPDVTINGYGFKCEWQWDTIDIYLVAYYERKETKDEVLSRIVKEFNVTLKEYKNQDEDYITYLKLKKRFESK